MGLILPVAVEEVEKRKSKVSRYVSFAISIVLLFMGIIKSQFSIGTQKIYSK